MIEQIHTQGTIPPVEGRSDIAADLEEEQRNAYSAHHLRTAVQKREAMPKPRQQQGLEQQQAVETLPPTEGRPDVAADLEEEQRDAYSAHHARTSS